MSENLALTCDPMFWCPRDAYDLPLYRVVVNSGSGLLRLVCALAYEAQLSFDQICDLNCTDFNLMDHSVAVKSDPASPTHLVPYGIESLVALFAWLKHRLEDVDDGCYGALLHDEEGSRLTPGQIEDAFAQLVARSPHLQLAGKRLADLLNPAEATT